MKKILKWLLGHDETIKTQPITVMYCRGWDETNISDSQLLEIANDFCRPLGYSIEPENFVVSNYSDLQDKFDFKQPTRELSRLIEKFGDLSTEHLIILHKGTCQFMWDYSTKLGQLLLRYEGKLSYCNIGYNEYHQTGCSYIVGKSDKTQTKANINIFTESEFFNSVKGQMFVGLGKD